MSNTHQLRAQLRDGMSEPPYQPTGNEMPNQFAKHRRTVEVPRLGASLFQAFADSGRIQGELIRHSESFGTLEEINVNINPR